jgi:hypothetical protein
VKPVSSRRHAVVPVLVGSDGRHPSESHLPIHGHGIWRVWCSSGGWLPGWAGAGKVQAGSRHWSAGEASTATVVLSVPKEAEMLSPSLQVPDDCIADIFLSHRFSLSSGRRRCSALHAFAK